MLVSSSFIFNDDNVNFEKFRDWMDFYRLNGNQNEKFVMYYYGKNYNGEESTKKPLLNLNYVSGQAG